MDKHRHETQITDTSFTAPKIAERLGEALKRARQLVGPTIRSRRFRQWGQLPSESTGRIMVGIGPPSEFEISAQEIEDAFYWLEDADWLDDLLDVQRPLSESHTIDELLALIGDPGQPAFAASLLPPGQVEFDALLAALYMLRHLWLVNNAIQQGDSARAKSIYMGCHALGFVPTALLAGPESDDGLLLGCIRLWSISIVSMFFLPGSALVEQPSGRFALVMFPGTPLQLLAVSVGVSLGAIETNMPGVHACDYPPCGRIFVGNRFGKRGSHIFCSPRCGRRFSASVHIAAKRAAQRTARSQQQPES